MGGRVGDRKTWAHCNDLAGARCRIKPIVYIYGTFAGNYIMDDTTLVTKEEFLYVNQTIVTEWVGLSCELYKMKLMLFVQFLLLVYVVFKLEKQLEKVEKQAMTAKGVKAVCKV